MDVDHFGIAVASIDEARRFWLDVWGGVAREVEEIPGQGARVMFVERGSTLAELLEPTRPDSPLARFLASGRRGLHHIAFGVGDIDGEIARLRARGVRLVHDRAMPGSRGTRVAFLHPRSTGGVLIELVEHPR